jgi:hypothetical protein
MGSQNEEGKKKGERERCNSKERAKNWEVRLFYIEYYMQGIHASGAGERRSEARDNHPPDGVDHRGLLPAEGAAGPPQKGKGKGWGGGGGNLLGEYKSLVNAACSKKKKKE